MCEHLELPPAYHYHRLSNGIELIGQALPSLRSATFGCQFEAAVIHEPEAKQGLAHLFESMWLQGTQKHDTRSLHNAFEALGAHKGINTGFEMARLWVQVVDNKLEKALQLANELILAPTFPADTLGRVQKIISQEIHRRDDESTRRIVELTRAQFYRGTTLARSLLGTTESVAALDTTDLVDFWHRRYQPDAMLFAIAGRFQWDEVVAQMEELFGDWQGHAVPMPLQQPHPASTLSVEYRESQQEHLCMMFPFPNYADPDYYAALIANDILGGNMNSRLFVEVREKRSLVYSVSSALISNRSMGAVRIYAGTTPEQGLACLSVILDELHKLEQDGISQHELQLARTHLKSQNILRSESSRVCMGTLAHSWWFERKLSTLQDFKAAIDAVTQEQVLRVLRRFSPVSPLTMTALGPLERDLLHAEVQRHNQPTNVLTRLGGREQGIWPSVSVPV